jgi:transcriptional/translational regulatory protein YebC/TACO1
MFHRKGSLTLPAAGQKLGEDEIMNAILEAGADDMQTETDAYTIVTSPQAFETVKKALEQANVAIESAGLQMIPQNTVKVSGKEAEQLLKLLEALEEHDDVQNVYANFDIDEKELAALNG